MNKQVTVTEVDIIRGPIGGYGFRNGEWTAKTDDGRTFKFYGSIPHALELSEQEAELMRTAQRELDAGQVTFDA